MIAENRYAKPYVKEAYKISRRMENILCHWDKKKQRGLQDKQWNAVATAILFLTNKGLPKNSIERSRQGIIFADDVGIGKTYEALGLISYLHYYNPQVKILIICPSWTLLDKKWAQNGCEYNTPDACPSCTKGNVCTSMSDCEGILPAFFGKKLLTKRPLFKPSDICIQWNKRDAYEITDIKGWKRRKRFKLLVTTFHLVKSKSSIARRNKWDYILVEECHHLRNRNSQRWKTLNAIREENPHAKFIFLTATPFQVDHVNEILNIMYFLDSNYIKYVADNSELRHKFKTLIKNVKQSIENGGNPQTTNQIGSDSLVAQIEIGLRALSWEFEKARRENNISEMVQIIKRLYRLAQEDHDFDRRTTFLTCTSSNLKQQGLDDYFRLFIIRSYKDRLPKPIIAIRKINTNNALNYLKLRHLIYKNKKLDRISRISDIFRIQQFCCDSEVLRKYHCEMKNPPPFNIKEQALLDILKKIWPKFPFTKKIVIFCNHRHSWFAIKSAVRKHREWLQLKYQNRITKDWKKRTKWSSILLKDKIEKGKEPEILRRGIASECRIDNRRNTLRGFLNKQGLPLLLVATKRFSEGLDMEKGGCKICIHFETHWNPAVIEQREGRIYRGSEIEAKDKFRIYVFYIPDTLDQKMYETSLLRKKFKDFLLGDTKLSELLEMKGITQFIKQYQEFKVDLSPIKIY